MENIALQFEYEEISDQKFISRIRNASEINKDWVFETLENCYNECGDQGGECDFCKGFCCSNSSEDKSNGNCPAVALSLLRNSSEGNNNQFYCITEEKTDDKKEFNLSNKEPIEQMDTLQII